MKARRKGTKEFKEIETVTFVDDNRSAFLAENLEFAQDSNLTPDHWQDVRERAAIAAMHALCVSPSRYTENITLDEMAQHVVKVADALVKKLKGE